MPRTIEPELHAASAAASGHGGPGGDGEGGAAPRPEHPGSDPAATYRLSHLRTLEAEAVHVMREVAAELASARCCCSAAARTRSCCCASRRRRSARGRSRSRSCTSTPATTSPRRSSYRDRRVAEFGERLIVASVEESIGRGRVEDATGPYASRNALQTVTLLDAIAAHGFDAAFGGARRDEERARAKERILSFRDEHGQWEPQRQRPEVWSLFNGRIGRGEHVRVFPISNWTELDVWQYIAEEQLEVPSIYFAHQREVFERDGMLYAVNPFVELVEGERPFTARRALPHGGGHELHGGGGVGRGDARGGRRGDRRHRCHRARPDTRGRSRGRGGDGGSQAEGVLLTLLPSSAAPVCGHSDLYLPDPYLL